MQRSSVVVDLGGQQDRGAKIQAKRARDCGRETFLDSGRELVPDDRVMEAERDGPVALS